MHRANESLLFKDMQQGNASALEYFFQEYMEAMYYRAFGIIGDSAAAEDIVQEVFIRFWQLKEGLAITGSVAGYLYRAVDNRCRDHLDHLQVKRRYEAECHHQELEYPNDDEEEYNTLREQLKQFIDSLPEKCREIFFLACIEGLKYKEVADKLNVSVNTVKTQLKSAYNKLRTEFGEEDRKVLILLIMLHRVIR